MVLGLPRHCSALPMFAEAYKDDFQAIIRANSLLTKVADKVYGPFKVPFN